MRVAPRSEAVRSRRRLVAGIGNVFRSDDAFGSEVARILAARTLPEDVHVVDYGIRGMHLAYDLLDGWDTLVLVDTVPARGQPGCLHLLSVGTDDLGSGAFDPHGMDPATVLGGVTSLGGTLPPTIVVGCEPADLEEGMGLSPAVAASVPAAADAIERLLSEDRFPAGGPRRRVDAERS